MPLRFTDWTAIVHHSVIRRPSFYVALRYGREVPSHGLNYTVVQEAMLRKRFGGLLPKKAPILSKVT